MEALTARKLLPSAWVRVSSRWSAKGYGNALMGGISAARGEFVIMGDADDSYDFTCNGADSLKSFEGRL